MNNSRFFRAGIGTVVYRDHGDVAFFRRSKYPIGVWQFQQGGIDVGESIEQALWRELREEIGLSQAHFDAMELYPGWLSYADPNAVSNASRDRLGQTHQWYFLKLNRGMTIDIKRATDREFDGVKWVSFEEAIAETDNFKKPVYQALGDYFTKHIRPQL